MLQPKSRSYLVGARTLQEQSFSGVTATDNRSVGARVCVCMCVCERVGECRWGLHPVFSPACSLICQYLPFGQT